MHLGWLAAEFFVSGALPRSVDAFLFCKERLLCHLELRPGRRFARRAVRGPLHQLMQPIIVYNAVEIAVAERRGIPLLKTMWAMDHMRRRWREFSACPPMPAFYEGALCLRPRGRSPRSPARLVLPPGLCADLRVVLLVPNGQLLPEPCTIYYREQATPRIPVAKAPWKVLGSCQLQAQTCTGWQLLHGAVEPYALPVVEGGCRFRGLEF